MHAPAPGAEPRRRRRCWPRASASTSSPPTRSTHRRRPPGWPLDELVDVGRSPRRASTSAASTRRRCAPRNVDVRVLWAGAGTASCPRPGPSCSTPPLCFGLPGPRIGAVRHVLRARGGPRRHALRRRAPPDRADAQRARALDALFTLAARAPDALTDWHYDRSTPRSRGEVSARGGVARRDRRSGPRADLCPHAYLASRGPALVRWVPRVGDPADLRRPRRRPRSWSCSAPPLRTRSRRRSGAVSRALDVFAAVEPVDDVDARRLEITRATIADGMITYPPLADFPAIEDAGWEAMRRAAGRGGVADARSRSRRPRRRRSRASERGSHVTGAGWTGSWRSSPARARASGSRRPHRPSPRAGVAAADLLPRTRAPGLVPLVGDVTDQDSVDAAVAARGRRVRRHRRTGQRRRHRRGRHGRGQRRRRVAARLRRQRARHGAHVARRPPASPALASTPRS